MKGKIAKALLGASLLFGNANAYSQTNSPSTQQTESTGSYEGWKGHVREIANPGNLELRVGTRIYEEASRGEIQISGELEGMRYENYNLSDAIDLMKTSGYIHERIP